MASEWLHYCRAKDFEVQDEAVTVSLPDGRRHRVRVEDAGEIYQLVSVVVSAAHGDGIDDLPIRTWKRSRGTELVGFRIDRKGRLVGMSWVPKAGLSEAEFQLYVRTLATECDRYEFELTGQDA
jgi:hypothetical protein